jgi:hypothetical protein
MTTKLQDVARALADEDPEFMKIAKQALGQIEARVQQMRSEADTIRRLMDHVAAVGINGQVPVSSSAPPAARPSGDEGLSDTEKEQINKLIENILVDEPGIEAEALVPRVEAAGIPISDRVARPASVIGTILYHARRRARGRAASVVIKEALDQAVRRTE